MKRCSKCKIEKKEDCFWIRNNRKSGVNSECKECAKERRTKKYAQSLEESRKKRNAYYAKNREKLCKGQIESQKGNTRYRKYQNKYLIDKVKSGDKKFIARRIVCMALKAKMIERPDLCSNCLIKEKVEAHHYDYDKPLNIIWLCTQCHRALHKRLKEEVKNGS